MQVVFMKYTRQGRSRYDAENEKNPTINIIRLD